MHETLIIYSNFQDDNIFIIIILYRYCLSRSNSVSELLIQYTSDVSSISDTGTDKFGNS